MLYDCRVLVPLQLITVHDDSSGSCLRNGTLHPSIIRANMHGARAQIC
jgi:hypothetical protein